jgi:hypothetical protein
MQMQMSSTASVESVLSSCVVICNTSVSSSAAARIDKKLKHKRRYCRNPGCTNIVKSQGLCQRHGAKPRMCKVVGCSKQAQGNFDGMCKSHFKAHKRTTTPLPPRPPAQVASSPPPAEGQSVYETVIPASVAWDPSSGTAMPLIQHLKSGFENPNKPPAWHRNEERRARGLWHVHNPATQLESWERELVWTEILLLTGNTDASFRHLARGWGRDKGFHMVLAQFICERHGNVERKKRKKMAEDAAAALAESDDYVVGGDLYDEAIYGDAAYNEALAADLFAFDELPQEHESHHERMFSFEDCVVSVDDGQDDSGSSSSNSMSSEQRDDHDEHGFPLTEITAV